MPQFVYQATDRNGKIFSGVMDAKDEAMVVRRLQEQRFYPIKIQPKVQQEGISREISFKDLFKRIKSKDVMLFTHQISVLTEAGLPLDRSLEIAADLAENPRMQGVIREILHNVRGGSSFADALARHPRLFSRLYVNMVKSGEAGGVLDKILSRLAEFLEGAQEMRQYIISALIYPILLILVGGAAVAILLTFVIPKFAQIFEDVNATMPTPTLILINFAQFIKHWFWLIILIFLALFLGVRSYLKTEKGRRIWDYLKLNLPLFGDLIKKIEVSRFSRTLGTLSQSGVPILKALSIVKETVTNIIMANAISKAYEDIKEGGGISKPLAESDVFPPMAIHMLAVGEETGNMETMLLKIASVYDSEVKNTVKRLISLLEPAMILFMGLVVGSIVLAMLMAIFSINDIPM